MKKNKKNIQIVLSFKTNINLLKLFLLFVVHVCVTAVNIISFQKLSLFCFFTDSEAKAKIIAGIRHWESVTCLTFVPIQDISSGQWTKLGHRNFLNIVNGNGYVRADFPSSVSLILIKPNLKNWPRNTCQAANVFAFHLWDDRTILCKINLAIVFIDETVQALTILFLYY